MLISFLTIAAFIFLTYRILHIVMNKIAVSNNYKRYVSYALPIFEFISWLAYFAWISLKVYHSKNQYALIAIGLLFLLLFIPLILFLRDFVLGIALKIQNKIYEGSYIEMEDLKGTVSKAGHFRLEILDVQGNINSVPYHLMRSKVIKKHGDNQNLKKVDLRFSFPSNTKIHTIAPILLRQVMNTPWVSISQKPIIEEAKIENDKLIIDIGAYTLDLLYKENIQEMVESYFEIEYDKLN